MNILPAEPHFGVCFLRALPGTAGSGLVQESRWLDGALKLQDSPLGWQGGHQHGGR